MQEQVDYVEYQAQVNRQLDQLVAHRQLTKAQEAAPDTLAAADGL